MVGTSNYYALMDLANERNLHREHSMNKDLIAHQGAMCVGGNCAYTGNNIRFMTALVQTPSLIAILSRHDHRDN